MQSDKGTEKTKPSPHTQLEGGSSRWHPSLLTAPGQLATLASPTGAGETSNGSDRPKSKLK